MKIEANLKPETPETDLADLFAMPVEALIVTTASPLGVTVSLKITGGNMVKVLGAAGEDWRDVLARAMRMAAENREAHV